MAKILAVKHQAAGTRSPGVYLLKCNGTVIGTLEKYRDTRTEHHPWKAFLGTGWDREYLGGFYEPRTGWPSQPGGGKKAAIEAVRLRVAHWAISY